MSIFESVHVTVGGDLRGAKMAAELVFNNPFTVKTTSSLATRLVFLKALR